MLEAICGFFAGATAAATAIVAVSLWWSGKHGGHERKEGED